VQAIESLTHDELQYPHAITSFVALYDDILVGFCTFKPPEDVRPDLRPWLSDLVVAPQYQKQGIGKMLMNTAIQKARELGFAKLYLFTFHATLTPYYQKLGWKQIGFDEFKSHPVTVMEIEI